MSLLASATIAAVGGATASASPNVGGANQSLQAAGSGGVGPLTRRFTPPKNIPFTTEYDAAGYYGAVKCKGRHETNEKRGYPGNATEGGRDVEKCKSTTGKPLVGLTPGETVPLGAGWFPGSSGWDSDYDGQAASAIGYTVSTSGKSFKLIAYYPFS